MHHAYSAPQHSHTHTHTHTPCPTLARCTHYAAVCRRHWSGSKKEMRAPTKRSTRGASRRHWCGPQTAAWAPPADTARWQVEMWGDMGRYDGEIWPRRSTPRSGRRRCSVVAVAGRVGRWRSLTAASPLTCCLSASASASASLSPPSPLPHRAAPSPLQAALEQASLSLTSTVDLGEEYGLRHRPWATLLPPCWLVTTGSLTSHHAG